MNDIQKARDVLAKWREKAATGAWTEDHIAELRGKRDGRLIVGTAGNPDLLDAIDLFLEHANLYEPGPFRGRAALIAAAILSADQRMQQ